MTGWKGKNVSKQRAFKEERLVEESGTNKLGKEGFAVMVGLATPRVAWCMGFVPQRFCSPARLISIIPKYQTRSPVEHPP